MVTKQVVSSAAASVASVYTLVEDNFLTASERLAGVVDTLGTLTDCFGRLIVALESAQIGDAATALTSAAAELRAIYDTITAEMAPLESLAGCTDTVIHGAQRMRAIVGEVGALAVNARLAAVAIENDQAGLLSFSSEIRRSASVAQDNLTSFTEALGAVSRHVAAALDQHRAFESRHRDTILAIPDRIAQNLQAIRQHGTQARSAALDMDRRTRGMANKVGIAVNSLQFGDITRQRIEHAQLALTTAIRVLDATDPAADLVCRVAAAQLVDMADEFEQECARILDSLRALAPEAAAFSRAGRSASNSSHDGKAAFLEALTADVRVTIALLDELEAARAVTSQSVTNVMGQIGILNDHLRMVQAAEAEIHIMGLNTTLKCGRLGNRGRPMSVIAQALRSCGGQTAAQVSDVRTNLLQMKQMATALAAQGVPDGAAAPSGTTARMKAAVAGLAEAGAQASAALEPLAPTSARITQVLEETVTDFAVYKRICSVLRQTGTDLAAMVEDATTAAGLDSATIAAALHDIGACYTMQRERDVHNRACGGLHVVGQYAHGSSSALATPALAQQALEDILF